MAFDLREAAVQGVMTDELRTLHGGRVIQFGTNRKGLDRPFVVVKFGLELVHPRWRNGPTFRDVNYHVHDDPLDFARIDRIIDLMKVALAKTRAEEEFFESRYMSRSQDFEDPDLGTIFRIAQWSWTLSS